jgi:hypothetical protein
MESLLLELCIEQRIDDYHTGQWIYFGKAFDLPGGMSHRR